MATSQTYSRENPPETLCLLRLSALGDITHVLPTLRTLQQHWPKTEITWIIGKSEYQLVKDISDVHFIVFDKSAGFSAFRLLKKQLMVHTGNRAFDVLLHMQLSIRASIASLFIPAKIKLGFDKQRAKDLQTLFCNRQIKPESSRQHVLDSFLEFPRYFGLPVILQWQLPVSGAAVKAIRKKLHNDKDLFVINPCAVAKAKNWRNWTTDGYATVADIVSERYGMQVVISGGPSELEKDTAEQIISLCRKAAPINLVAQTNIAEMVATLQLASIVLAPDTGPVHIASALGTDTIGLYASTNPDRAGPYNHREYTVNRYPDALLQYHQQTVEQASWGKRIRTAECMKLITVDDVLDKIDLILSTR
jgi:heptosyltransferase I